MNKICTTIEQSKKLIELGIDVNTADMHYSTWTILNEGEYILSPNQGQTIEELQEDYGNQIIPAWSLSALLGLMPKLYEFENDPDDGGCQPNLCKGWDNNQWHIVYRSSIYITEWYDEPLDAAFEMICWLKENGKI